MPSEKILEAKKAKVEKLTEVLQGAVSAVLVDYKGITVEEDTKLRKELREAGVNYFVEKNSLLRFAFKNIGMDSFDDVLHGTTAIAVSTDDQTAPARILAKYAKQYPALELVAGIVEGNYNDQAGIQALSQVPSRDELLGKLLGSIQSPITNFARVLKQIAEAGGESAAPAAEEAAEAEAPAAE